MSAQMVIIEGLIGIGKTTLTEQLAQKLGYKVMHEPVDDNPYLTKYYDNPSRYALEMQFWLMSRRFDMHRQAVEHIWRTGQGVIMDRSIYGDAVFAKKNYLDGNIDEMGYKNYLFMRDVMFRYLLVPQLTILLSAPVDVCLDRISSRDRDCERSIPSSYLDGLQKLYVELMEELKSRGSNILKLDWTTFRPIEEVLSLLKSSKLLGYDFLSYPNLTGLDHLQLEQQRRDEDRVH